jgi:glycosyltransferase involved in cell wall biosynthesis
MPPRMDNQASNPVSVVMTVRNAQPGLLAASLASLRAQTLATFELLVLEDPPHGAVEAALRAQPDARFRHERGDRPRSMAEARNHLLAQARGDLVAILDADDVCQPGRLAAQVAFLRDNPGIDVLGTAIELIDADDRSLGFRSHPTTDETIRRRLRRSNPIAHPSVMFRRRAVIDAGGYRTLPHGTCDDYDLWSRLARRGARFANLPQALLRYRIHAGATKARQLRATLRDTIWLKREHWRSGFDLGDRLRLLGERALLWLPPRLVTRLFVRTQIDRRPPAVEGS